MSEMKIRVFTISDYEEEEKWLREQHKKGLRLVKMTAPCFYYFEECAPEDVVYRLDYKNGKEDSSYKQMFEDYGWEYFEDSMGWLYFRKPASKMESEEESEIFSDAESKLSMIEHIFKTRMLPLAIIFCCCLLPNIGRMMTMGINDSWDIAFCFIYGFIFAIYIYLFVHCGFKFKNIRNRLKQEQR